MKKLMFLLLLIVIFAFGLVYYKDLSLKKVDKVDNVKETEKNGIVIDSKYKNDLFYDKYVEATKILDKMSLEEKIGQLFLVRYDKSITDDYISNYYVGGFILFAKDFENHTMKSISDEISAIQNESSLPLTIAVDEEGGYVTRVSRFTNFRDSKFLSPKDYYETGGYELLEQMENEKISLLKNIGINLNLAPVVDIPTSPNDFIYSRSFGLDAKETSIFAKNMVKYSKNNYFSSCLKHFPGYGNNVDTHTGVAIDNREYEVFEKSDYLPFKAGIDEGVPFILISHNIVNSIDSNYPSSLSNKVITGELRNKLKFTGIVVTDDLDMDAVKSYAIDGNAATLAINAGADMIITSDYINMYNEILNSVSTNTIDISVIDEAVRRIIAWKLSYGLK